MNPELKDLKAYTDTKDENYNPPERPIVPGWVWVAIVLFFLFAHMRY